MPKAYPKPPIGPASLARYSLLSLQWQIPFVFVFFGCCLSEHGSSKSKGPTTNRLQVFLFIGAAALAWVGCVGVTALGLRLLLHGFDLALPRKADAGDRADQRHVPLLFARMTGHSQRPRAFSKQHLIECFLPDSETLILGQRHNNTTPSSTGSLFKAFRFFLLPTSKNPEEQLRLAKPNL